VKPFIICLMGPTASGKTDLAVELAQRLPCEIISVDSAMIYRGMDIGTAKPSPEILRLAPHRLLDICDPADVYSAGNFKTDALREMNDILSHQKIPLLVGGTMLYFHLLQHGLNDLPVRDQQVRQQILDEAATTSWPELHKKLIAIDPKAGKRIHPHDSQRIQRALEVYKLTGKSISDHHQQLSLSYPFDIHNIILSTSNRSCLHQRIEQRFLTMLQSGFIEEVKRLHTRADLSLENPALRSVGYRQVWEYLEGQISYSEMQDKGIIATRQLAKRQLTWLRRWEDAAWFDSEEDNIVEKVMKYMKDII
jgi:tRNA dimethylallyltransferase